MADRHGDIGLFQIAPEQRLLAAEFLLKHEFYLDAVHLAGYTVECALKTLYLARNGPA